MKISPRSLFGSKRSRFFREPKAKGGKSFSFRRKQRVRFRSRYAGSVARQWSRTLINTTVGTATIAAALWGSMALLDFWKTSDALRVKNVVFVGDIPDRLRVAAPAKINDHLLKINPWRLEEETLVKYPELESVSVRRGFNGTLTIRGRFRTPVAFTHAQGDERAIDSAGTVFHCPPSVLGADALPWVETASADDRRLLLTFLSTWKKETPDFYSLVKKIETDRMRELNVELSDGVSINWGPLEEADILNRAKKIIRFREFFHPLKTPAALLFVSSDRIVMDKNWQKAGPTGK